MYRVFIWLLMMWGMVLISCQPTTRVIQPEPEVVTPVREEPAEEDKYQKMLEEAGKHISILEQQNKAQAEYYYEIARKYFDAGNLDTARYHAELALRSDPKHIEARNLLSYIKSMQGEGVAVEAEKVEQYMQRLKIRRQEFIHEIESLHFVRAQRAIEKEDFDTAERELKTIIEKCKIFPMQEPAISAWMEKASKELVKVKELKKKKVAEEELKKREVVEMAEKAQEQVRLEEQRRTLEMMFEQAMIAFENRDFDETIRICDRMLYINPNLATVMDVKAIAQKLRYQDLYQKYIRDYVLHWKKTFLNVDMVTYLPKDLIEFPEEKIWLEQIARRPVDYFVQVGEVIPPEDRELEEKIRETRITLELVDQPLVELINFLRMEYGINIEVSRDIDPSVETISIKVDDVPIATVLKYALTPRGWGFYIEQGIIHIVPQEQVKKRIVFEIYRVDDLLLKMTDFKITVKTEGAEPVKLEADEEKSLITAEQLTTMIKTFIDSQDWTRYSDVMSVEVVGGLLFVNAPPSTHEKIKRFLGSLRSLVAIMVNIEVRFLRVSDTFLELVGVDFRHVNGYRVQGLLRLDDLNTMFSPQIPWPFPTLPYPLDTAAGIPRSGIAGVYGDKIPQYLGVRVQHVLRNDTLLSAYYGKHFDPSGGANIQITLLDDTSVEALLKLVRKFEKSHDLLAQSVTLYNGQRGTFFVASQLTYVKDWDIQQLPDPVISVINDGIVLDVRPRVGSDRRFVNMDIRPTVIKLFRPIEAITTDIIGQMQGGGGLPGGQPGWIVYENMPFETPRLEEQRVRSIAVVPDRATILLGGFLDYFEELTESGIPGLKDLPLIGFLAREKVKATRRMQLLILCRPRIIIPSEEEKRRFE